MRHTYLCTVALGLAVVAGGCGGDDKEGTQSKQSAQTVESLGSVRRSVKAAPAEIDRLVASIDKLAAGGDIATAFKEYSANVDRIEQAGTNARQRSQAMRTRAKDYISAWEQEQAQIQSPELRQGMEQRRAAVRQNFDKIRSASEGVRDAYQPLLRELKEIETAISNDLTPAGVTVAKPAMEKAKKDAQTLKDRLKTVEMELDRVAGEMSAAPPKAT